MRKLFTLLLILYAFPAGAQHGWHLRENAIWNFADSLGLDFNSGSPDTFSATVPSSYNCIASVSDPGGHMLFYTNSEYIWDRNGNVMPGGYLLSSPIIPPPGWVLNDPFFDATSHGAPQGVLILPVIANPKQYYVFTLAGYVFGEDIGGPTSFMWLNYSIVDMTQNSGLGAVISGPHLIDTNMSAHMTAVPGDNCNIWLLCHEKRAPRFKAFEITAAGINMTPVISNTGFAPVVIPDLGNYSHGYGSMAVTPDRKKLAYTSPYQLFPETNGGKQELFDFNTATGVVSNELLLDSFYSWDLAFSADNSKLYFTSCNFVDDVNSLYPFQTLLYQFDLSQPTPAAIAASRVTADTIKSPYAVTTPIRLTRDGKIYYIMSNSAVPGDADYLGAIQQPNLAGTACDNEPHAVLMPHRLYPDDNTSGIGCNGFVRPIPADTLFGRKDTIICTAGDSIRLQGPPALYYSWNTGSTDTGLTIKLPGTYWVGSAQTYCQYRIDTFVVAPPFTFSLGNDTVICNQSAFELKAPPSAASYQWQDNSTSQRFIADTTGLYWVNVRQRGCQKADSIYISFKDLRMDLGSDSTLCRGVPVALTLDARVKDPNATFLWNTGQTGGLLPVTDTGYYVVDISDAPCVFSDAIHIGDEICSCIPMIPTAFSPNRDGLNDVFGIIFSEGCPIKHFRCSIYNRFGQRIYSSNDPGKAWDGTWNGKPADVGTYMYAVTAETGTQGKVYQLKGDITLLR
ncbi:gliding motility-associated C-terminal domain-containing protein [Taibaiella koreensis]|uniref:gliding motility-associated C-terminal domain-containing protein n=1 Tax=Taibaiella koreensis TaxID=1268548 RepID=UPI000E59AA2B|nr:gliding motility-associated C-terminal domain-containing protein [Taibaiella koreensis]